MSLRCYICFKCNSEIEKKDYGSFFCNKCRNYVMFKCQFTKKCYINDDCYIKTDMEVDTCSSCEDPLSTGNTLYNEFSSINIHLCSLCQDKWEIAPCDDLWFKDSEDKIWCPIVTTCEDIISHHC